MGFYQPAGKCPDGAIMYATKSKGIERLEVRSVKLRVENTKKLVALRINESEKVK